MRCAHPDDERQILMMRGAERITAASHYVMSSKHSLPWSQDQMLSFPRAMRDVLEEGRIAEAVFGQTKEARRDTP
jgi:hypothetical protein